MKVETWDAWRDSQWRAYKSSYATKVLRSLGWLPISGWAVGHRPGHAVKQHSISVLSYFEVWSIVQCMHIASIAIKSKLIEERSANLSGEPPSTTAALLQFRSNVKTFVSGLWRWLALGYICRNTSDHWHPAVCSCTKADAGSIRYKLLLQQQTTKTCHTTHKFELCRPDKAMFRVLPKTLDLYFHVVNQFQA